LSNRKLPADRIVTPEFGRALTEVSHEIQRQVGVLIDRRGHIREVLVGDNRSLLLPDLSSYRLGRDRLSGLRLVHTHLYGETITDDDFADLALLRLDLVAAIAVGEEGLPGDLYIAHLLPYNERGLPWAVLPATTVHELADDFLQMVEALEEEFARLRRPRAAGDLRDRAILLHVSTEPPALAEESLTELRELCRSAGLNILDQSIQRRKIDPRYVLGKGKLQETVIRAMQLGAEVLVFDLNLSPSQVKALAAYTDLKVLDRTQVILDIFAQHAVTREGKIQVELAQLRYLLPRLGAKHTGFSRLTGGIGGRGPGETKLEVDRRRAQDRIALLSREVKKLGDRRKLRRSRRTQKGVPVVSIVGYTNAGKSTLLNRLTNSEVTAEDALFATLNPVSRRLRFPEEREVVITDTVGFIRQLPEDLMAAFKTTFEEIYESDLLLHVLDASAHNVEEQYATVRQVLHELDLTEKPIVVVLNKIDLVDAATVQGLTRRYNGVPVSALNRDTFTPLLHVLETHLWGKESGREI
jgi:GTP-binding protein HflX